jgi:tRNA-modifying protein YgfZ
MKSGVLREIHRVEARSLMAYHDWEVPAVYTSVDQEFQAATNGAVLVDHSPFGRLEVHGHDGIDLLHRLSTNDLLSMPSGQILPTILTTDKGRMVDYLLVAKRSPAPLLVVSPNNEETVTHWVDRYCITEDVRLRCVTNDTSMFAFIGPRSQEFAAAILEADLPSGMITETKVGHARIAASCVETSRARTVYFLVENSDAKAVWTELSYKSEKLGVLRMGFASYEAFRIARGIPEIGREITLDFNPHEVAFRDAVNTTKGCYIGQEVIARLETYQKVQRKLVGIMLTDRCPLASGPVPLHAGGVDVGIMTSWSNFPVNGRHMALGIVRNDLVHEGDSLRVGDSSVRGIAITTPILLKNTELSQLPR